MVSEQKVIETIVDVVREHLRPVAPTGPGQAACPVTAPGQPGSARPPAARVQAGGGQASGFKRGFYTREPYLHPYASLKGRPFISEADVRDAIRKGEKVLRVPRGAILSPVVKELVQSRGITVEEAG